MRILSSNKTHRGVSVHTNAFITKCLKFPHVSSWTVKLVYWTKQERTTFTLPLEKPTFYCLLELYFSLLLEHWLYFSEKNLLRKVKKDFLGYTCNYFFNQSATFHWLCAPIVIIEEKLLALEFLDSLCRYFKVKSCFWVDRSMIQFHYLRAQRNEKCGNASSETDMKFNFYL